MTRVWTLLIVFSLIVTTCCVCFGDVIYLADGREIEGEIVSQDETVVKIKKQGVVFSFEMKEVIKIERKEDPKRVLQNKLDNLSKPTIDELWQLVEYAKEHNLQTEEKSILETILTLDGKNEKALAALKKFKYEKQPGALYFRCPVDATESQAKKAANVLEKRCKENGCADLAINIVVMEDLLVCEVVPKERFSKNEVLVINWLAFMRGKDVKFAIVTDLAEDASESKVQNKRNWIAALDCYSKLETVKVVSFEEILSLDDAAFLEINFGFDDPKKAFAFQILELSEKNTNNLRKQMQKMKRLDVQPTEELFQFFPGPQKIDKSGKKVEYEVVGMGLGNCASIIIDDVAVIGFFADSLFAPQLIERAKNTMVKYSDEFGNSLKTNGGSYDFVNGRFMMKMPNEKMLTLKMIWICYKQPLPFRLDIMD